MQLWRLYHDIERGPLWRWRVPEVFPIGSVPVTLDRAWQLFTKALNPDMTPTKWRALFRYNTAFSNFGNGYDYPDGTPKPDYINNVDLNATGKLRLDKVRVCGGALVTGTVSGTNLIVDVLDGNAAPPAVEDVAIWHKFVALNVVNETTLSRFPQGDGADVWIPLVSRETVKIPLAQLAKVDMTKPLPSPYMIYSPA